MARRMKQVATESFMQSAMGSQPKYTYSEKKMEGVLTPSKPISSALKNKGKNQFGYSSYITPDYELGVGLENDDGEIGDLMESEESEPISEEPDSNSFDGILKPQMGKNSKAPGLKSPKFENSPSS